jgi:long-chain acyl-CoA synthetase
MADHGFWTYAQKDPNALALVEPDGREWTRGELFASCNRIVHGLRALGLGKGDVVAALLPNEAAIIELYLAVAQAGMYLVPINWHLTAPEVAYIVQDSEAKVFVAHERFGDVASKAAAEARLAKERCFAVGAIPGFRPFADLSHGQPDTPPAERTAGAVMNYTSGTTGRPKGVRRPLPPIDPDIAATLLTGFFAMFGIKPQDGNVHMCGSPLYHTAVLVFSSTSLHYGHAVVLMERWSPEACLEVIQKYRVTTSHMVPTQFHRLLALPEDVRKRYDVSSVRCMVHAAAPCPVDVKKRMIEWWGPAICEYYAATEGGGTLVGAEEWMKKPGTVGRPWAGAEIRIYDDAGNQLPAGQIGTVYMKLGAADFEYYKDKEKTKKNRIENFFTVGDVGLLDEDGYLFLRDRKNDMIISGGVNIYPAEIENEFLSHPKVGDVAVFGIPHEEWGEEVKAVIEPAAGVEAGPALAAELLAWSADRLAKYKTPRTIDFIAEMPRDPNGKLYKRKLRDPYWAGRERSI